MSQHLEHLETLKEIRSIMDRSSRFISLSGLSGIFAGVYALAGAGTVKWYMSNHNILSRTLYNVRPNWDTIVFLAAVAVTVMVAAVLTCIYLTTRKARKANLPIWDKQAKRLMINMAIPLGAGGVFCVALLYHEIYYLVAPAMLIFYGMALLNGSKYTLRDIHYLGLLEIGLGLLACFFIGYGLLSWTIGFGVLHILYGSIMYFKYERGA
ncbi:MAG: TMEM128 family protein [Rufibacter sp.]